VHISRRQFLKVTTVLASSATTASNIIIIHSFSQRYTTFSGRIYCHYSTHSSTNQQYTKVNFTMPRTMHFEDIASKVLVFDWDDTICPSTFVDCYQIDHISELPQDVRSMSRNGTEWSSTIPRCEENYRYWLRQSHALSSLNPPASNVIVSSGPRIVSLSRSMCREMSPWSIQIWRGKQP